MASQQWLLSSWSEQKQERPRHREDVRSHHALCWGSPGGLLGDSVDGGCPGLCLRWRHLIYGIVDRQQPPQASQPPHSALSGVGSEPAHARTQADHGPCHPPPINTAGGGASSSPAMPSPAQPSSAQGGHLSPRRRRRRRRPRSACALRPWLRCWHSATCLHRPCALCRRRSSAFGLAAAAPAPAWPLCLLMHHPRARAGRRTGAGAAAAPPAPPRQRRWRRRWRWRGWCEQEPRPVGVGQPGDDTEAAAAAVPGRHQVARGRWAGAGAGRRQRRRRRPTSARATPP
jgi:hypothetical protein